MNVPAAVQKPSTWIVIASGVAAVAQALTQMGEPHLAVVGMVISAIFKVAEQAHDTIISAKKLEVEKQLVTVKGVTPPSVLISAEKGGVSLAMPAPKLDAPAPGLIPQPPMINPASRIIPEHHVPQG